MNTEASAIENPASGWRLKLGVALFGFSIIMPVFGLPLAVGLGLSSTMLASVSGVLLVGAEVLGLVAVAVMGKSGYLFIKDRIFGFLKKYGPPEEVSQLRYTVGLLMFSLPILFAWLQPYLANYVPGYSTHRLYYSLGGDLMLLTSLFVLGGEFWDKVRSLFVHGAKAVFPK